MGKIMDSISFNDSKTCLIIQQFEMKEDVQNKLNAVLQYNRLQKKPAALVQHQFKFL